jgi:hypothetical protein
VVLVFFCKSSSADPPRPILEACDKTGTEIPRTTRSLSSAAIRSSSALILLTRAGSPRNETVFPLSDPLGLSSIKRDERYFAQLPGRSLRCKRRGRVYVQRDETGLLTRVVRSSTRDDELLQVGSSSADDGPVVLLVDLGRGGGLLADLRGDGQDGGLSGVDGLLGSSDAGRSMGKGKILGQISLSTGLRKV